jgi:hypothetical protein
MHHAEARDLLRQVAQAFEKLAACIEDREGKQRAAAE